MIDLLFGRETYRPYKNESVYSRFGPIAQMGCNHDNGPFWDKEPKTGCKFILQKGNF